jgi:hypothetical protein
LDTFLIQAFHDARFGLPFDEFLEDAKDDGRLAGLEGHLVPVRVAHPGARTVVGSPIRRVGCTLFVREFRGSRHY